MSPARIRALKTDLPQTPDELAP